MNRPRHHHPACNYATQQPGCPGCICDPERLALFRKVEFAPIVFDLDDVLCSFGQQMARAIADLLGDDKHIDDWMDWTEYDVSHLYPQFEDFDVVFHHMESSGMMDTIPAIEEARYLCNAFYMMGHEIIILTARGWMKDPEGSCAQWLRKNGVLYDQLIVSGHQKSKRDYMPDGVICYFDDNAQHILDCADKVIRPYLVNRPWNAYLTEIPANAMRIETAALEKYGDAMSDLTYALNNASTADRELLIDTYLPGIRRNNR